MRYEILDLIQGSPDWLRARMEHVTASNVPAVLGISPYKTAYQYANELLSGAAEEDDGKAFLYQQGHAIEAAAREWGRANLGIEIEPAVVRSLYQKYLMASLDGMDEKKGIVFEAKYVGRDALHEIKSGLIKEHHKAQIQAQLLVTGFEMAIYFAMDPDGNAAVVDIARDEGFGRRIHNEVDEFWRGIQEGKLPKPGPKDVQKVEDPQILLLAELDAKLSSIQDQYDAVKREILAKYEKNLRTIECGGVSISKAFRKGTVDWAKLAEVKGIDPSEQERFRKAGQLVTTVKVKRGA
jgi:putative phage-type endonuclease